jgi:ABC-type Fe3+-hydroxamate transport system substrate-binding protein
VAAPPRRIVSLVPSLTEALYAYGLRNEIAGVTRYCVRPAALVASVPRVGGTKTPDLDAIRALNPDLIITSAEENVREHVERLIGDGLTVYVSLPDTVNRALDELHDLALLTGHEPDTLVWLQEARTLAAQLESRTAAPAPYFCPIWRRPYMVAGPDTYMSELLRLCGGTNIFDGGDARYYPVELSEAMARGPEVVLLPSEPYPFAEKHRAEVMAFADAPAVRARRVHLVDGQHVTWYGPRMAAAMRTLHALLTEPAGH